MQAGGQSGQLSDRTLPQNIKRLGSGISVVSACLPPTGPWVQSQHCPPKRGQDGRQDFQNWGWRSFLYVTWIQTHRGKQKMCVAPAQFWPAPTCHAPVVQHVCSRFLWLEAADAKENLPEVTGLVSIPSLASLDYRVPALFKRYVGTRKGSGRVTHEAERDSG